MVKGKNIGIDFDDVIIDSGTTICHYHNTKYNTKVTPKDLYTYEFQKVYGCDKDEMIDRIFKFYFTPEHKQTPPISGAIESIKRLIEYNNVFIVTGRPEGVKKQTEEWLREHLPELSSKVYFTGYFYEEDKKPDGITKKSICKDLEIDIFIEDAPVHVENVAPAVNRVFMLDTPWNQDYKDYPSNVKRVFSWKEILSYFISV